MSDREEVRQTKRAYEQTLDTLHGRDNAARPLAEIHEAGQAAKRV